MRKEIIRVIDRESGKLVEEKIESEMAIRLLYERLPRLFAPLRKALCGNSLFSKFVGLTQRTRFSLRKVEKFIEFHGLDRETFVKQQFNSFDDFFTRKLKKEARPIAKSLVVMPADGRYLAYDNFSTAKEIVVKGAKLSLFELLGKNQKLAEKYLHGSFVIARLAPPDYHRFHFPVDGKPLPPIDISGSLYSVNPLALRFDIKYLTENKRSLVTIKTPNIGDVLTVVVGATCVGTINYTHKLNHPAKKGDEMGYFSFGGSTLILLFEPGKIKLSEDILENSKKSIETLVKMGTPLGELA